VVGSREKVQILGFEPSYGHLWFFLGRNHEKHELLEIERQFGWRKNFSGKRDRKAAIDFGSWGMSMLK
jgi:hypothetical protein